MDHAIATTKRSMHIDNENDEEEEEDVCRICRNTGDADNPLMYPCACRGSIKFVHEDCLFQWLNYSTSLQCEVCKHSFSVSPVYAEKTPTRLPFHELVVGIATKARGSRVLRLCFVVLVWLLFVPFVTFWIWRLAFLRCLGEAQRLFLSHMYITVVVTDWLFGFILSSSIIFILREAGVRHLRVPLHDLVGIHGPLFRLIEHVFTVLASNMLFLGVVIFAPFTIGRVILLYYFPWLFVVTASSTLHDVTTLTVGYMFIVFLVFLHVGTILLIRCFKNEPVMVGEIDLIVWIVETVSPLHGLFSVVMSLIRPISYVVVLCGVVSLMFGWLLDVCTVSMFGQTMSHRLQFCSVSPLASLLIHWAIGFMHDCYVSEFECLLQEVLHRKLIYYVPNDDGDEVLRFMFHAPVHKFAQDVLLAGTQFASLIVLLVFLPAKLAIWMAPSIFPLHISVSDPFTEIPAVILLLTICKPFIIDHFRLRLRTTVVSLLRCWFTCAGWALGLTEFLLPKPGNIVGQDNGNGEPGRQNIEQVLHVTGPDRAMAALPAADDPNRSLLQQYSFVIRIILLILAAWVTLLLVHSTLIVVSVSLGRALFNAIPVLPITHGIKCNDLYAFFIGTYVFWTTMSGAMYAIKHVKSMRISVLLNQIWKWCGIVIKSSMLLGIWVLIIPILIGLLFELLVIVPIRVPVDESPIFLLYQDWALGLIFLKIWTRLIVDDSWRAKFVRVREDGFSRLQGLWILGEIVLPVVMKLLTALCVPYVLARGVFPMLGCPLVVNSAVYRFAWIGCLSASLLCLCAKRCNVWFRNLHNSIRDDRYIIGQRLHNYGEVARQT